MDCSSFSFTHVAEPYASVGATFNQPLLFFVFFFRETNRSELRSEIQVWLCVRKTSFRTLGQAVQS